MTKKGRSIVSIVSYRIEEFIQDNYSEALSARKSRRIAFKERKTNEEKPDISLALSGGGRSLQIEAPTTAHAECIAALYCWSTWNFVGE